MEKLFAIPSVLLLQKQLPHFCFSIVQLEPNCILPKIKIKKRYSLQYAMQQLLSGTTDQWLNIFKMHFCSFWRLLCLLFVNCVLPFLCLFQHELNVTGNVTNFQFFKRIFNPVSGLSHISFFNFFKFKNWKYRKKGLNILAYIVHKST